MHLPSGESLRTKSEDDHIAKLLEEAARELGFNSAEELAEAEPELFNRLFMQANGIPRNGE